MPGEKTTQITAFQTGHVSFGPQLRQDAFKSKFEEPVEALVGTLPGRNQWADQNTGDVVCNLCLLSIDSNIDSQYSKDLVSVFALSDILFPSMFQHTWVRCLLGARRVCGIETELL